MTFGNKSRKGFIAVTLLTVLSIVTVITVYAVLIGTFTGGEVTVGGMGTGNIMYSSTNEESATWTATLSSSGAGVAWFSRLEIASGGYSGPVTITWHLEKENATWTDVPNANATTSVVLTGATQIVYASTDGLLAANHDWGAHVTMTGTYHVIVDVESA